VACDVGHIGIEELIYSPNVFDPHEFQRWLEEAGKARQSVGHTGFEFNSITVCSKCFSGDLIVEKCVVVEEWIACRRTG
jgi:hypothetical protein